MRIWSLHPKYLDTKGLVALWRETLLAQHVLEGKTKGYKNHPQLNRFKDCEHPIDAINQYLAEIHEEATLRGYNFNKQKIDWNFTPQTMTVTSGQIGYEVQHLLNKLKLRDPNKFALYEKTNSFDVHTMFNIIDGPIEDWEII